MHLDYGFKIVMDRPGVDRHYKSSQLASLPSGVDPVNSCKGPANIFMLVECIWEDQPGLGGVPRRTAWVIVQFSRARRCAIIWDLAPSLNMRRKVREWAVNPKAAFPSYNFQHRTCSPPAIPASEWWKTAACQLSHLQYWLESYVQAECKREPSKPLPAMVRGFTYTRKRAKALKALASQEDS